MSRVTSRHIGIIGQINRRSHKYGTDVRRLRDLNFYIYISYNQSIVHTYD